MTKGIEILKEFSKNNNDLRDTLINIWEIDIDDMENDDGIDILSGITFNETRADVLIMKKEWEYKDSYLVFKCYDSGKYYKFNFDYKNKEYCFEKSVESFHEVKPKLIQVLDYEKIYEGDK